MTVFTQFSLTGQPDTDTGWSSSTSQWRVRVKKVPLASTVSAQMNGDGFTPAPRGWQLIFSIALLDESMGVDSLNDGSLMIMSAETMTIDIDALANEEFNLGQAIASFRTGLLEKAERWKIGLLAAQALL